MFDVLCDCPIDERWEERGDEVILKAGRKADAFCASCINNVQLVHYLWSVKNFASALRMKRRLCQVPGAVATLRERMTSVVPQYKK